MLGQRGDATDRKGGAELWFRTLARPRGRRHFSSALYGQRSAQAGEVSTGVSCLSPFSMSEVS